MWILKINTKKQKCSHFGQWSSFPSATNFFAALYLPATGWLFPRDREKKKLGHQFFRGPLLTHHGSLNSPRQRNEKSRPPVFFAQNTRIFQRWNIHYCFIKFNKKSFCEIFLISDDSKKNSIANFFLFRGHLYISSKNSAMSFQIFKNLKSKNRLS